jgi:hypothetical protein
VKPSGSCRSKLDRHDFKGIFLGYAMTDQNIVYLDLDSGVVKLSHHTQFDKAWYLQSLRPPAAQLLYDLGLLPENNPLQDPALVDNALRETYTSPGTVSPVVVPWPPLAPANECAEKWTAPVSSWHLHLPLHVLTKDNHRPTTARAARVKLLSRRNLAAELVEDFKIGVQDMSMIYMSPDPYHEVKNRHLLLNRNWLTKHTLRVILIKLQVFQRLPFIPIWLFQKFTSCEMHNSCDNIENITRIDEFVQRSACA